MHSTSTNNILNLSQTNNKIRSTHPKMLYIMLPWQLSNIWSDIKIISHTWTWYHVMLYYLHYTQSWCQVLTSPCLLPWVDTISLMHITPDCLPGAGQTAQTVNCCELTRGLTQAGAVCGQTLLLGQEGNRCVEWGIVAVDTTALVAGPTPCLNS